MGNMEKSGKNEKENHSSQGKVGKIHFHPILDTLIFKFLG